MIRFRTGILLLIFHLSVSSTLTSQTIDERAAAGYFREIGQTVRSDGGRFWGSSLDGPILFIHPQSRTVVASHPDRNGLLTAKGSVYTGTLPSNIPIANTATTWSGVTWAMIVWPVSNYSEPRNVLLTHELWHRIQGELGFPATDPANSHLDTRDGRLWLQLEMRALRSALASVGSGRREAVQDALLFRRKRYGIFPGSRQEERRLELHEGLAEYTGISVGIGQRDNRLRYAIQQLRQSEQSESFVRSFAYYTFPAYGLLLDEIRTGWHRTIHSNSAIEDLVSRAYGIPDAAVDRQDPAERARRYDGDNLAATESAREERRNRERANHLARFVENPRLILPLIERSISFDPQAVTPLDNFGRVYGVLSVRDRWGSLEATNGALMSNDWSAVYIDIPSKIEGSKITGNGYTLELERGWTVSRDERSGDYILKRAE